ncbi:5'-deoxynucleotidase [Paenibacillus phyllosphaerae]|uniref:5'-deoxynucleotidase n=1 Tax=Paenibacillus phyllosphaerae TaxID=274593 RepID=A0A7W5B4L5_9BACL|nr:5'-deoxynucleotidase [Paenibacillus phyllosphaerae]MBB3113586.1 5'-deoxynucleotidase [Paenibacillus phyllosphaerae]
MDNHFIAYMYRLRYIKRWSLMRNTTRENVAEHSYHVALLSHLLCEIGNQVFGRSLNADRAAAIALFHDATEVFTGDIPTPVKHHNPRMLSNFRELEAMAADRLVNMVPEPLKDVYEPLLREHAMPGESLTQLSEEERELRRMVKAADLLDAYIKCLSELSSGNREFAVAKGQIEQSLAKLNLPETEWFLHHMASAFSKTLDELSVDE